MNWPVLFLAAPFHCRDFCVYLWANVLKKKKKKCLYHASLMGAFSCSVLFISALTTSHSSPSPRSEHACSVCVCVFSWHGYSFLSLQLNSVSMWPDNRVTVFHVAVGKLNLSNCTCGRRERACVHTGAELRRWRESCRVFSFFPFPFFFSRLWIRSDYILSLLLNLVFVMF